MFSRELKQKNVSRKIKAQIFAGEVMGQFFVMAIHES
jgi:hypothetical protein